MYDFLLSYGVTTAVSLLVAVAVTFVIVKLVRDKKAGKHTGCSGCSGCPMHGSCEKEKKK